MYQHTAGTLRHAALAGAIVAGLGCASSGQAGFSIDARTGSKTDNPFEIRLSAKGSQLDAVLVSRSASAQKLLHTDQLQMPTLELISSSGSRHKPFDSRKLMKVDTTPYCHLFQTVAPGKKLELGSVSFRRARDGYEGQWGPVNFEELPPGDYQARVTWLSERGECMEENPRQIRKLPAVWRGVIHSNQVTLHLP